MEVVVLKGMAKTIGKVIKLQIKYFENFTS